MRRPGWMRAACLVVAIALVGPAQATAAGPSAGPADLGLARASGEIVGTRTTLDRIRHLPADRLPYVSTAIPNKTPPVPHDAQGIPMQWVGSRLVYKPAGLAQYAIAFEDAYRRTGDPDFLAIASKILAKLMALGTRSGDAVFIPYQFDFAMHGNPAEMMRAPWYSAMAQGLALSLAVRLHRDTGNARFRTDADLLFRSFRHLGRSSDPWVTYVDPAGYLWLEEYPEKATPSDHTANGFNFALFGLYDYFELTRSFPAEQLLRRALATMRHHIAAYRNPGTYSDYCLRHGKPQIKYHRVVTWQLEFLYRISGDPYFHRMSLAFRADYA